MRFSSEEYRQGAFDRFEDALALRDAGRWVGAAYCAGRAVEALLRGLLRRETLADTSGHDLRDLLKCVAGEGLIRLPDEPDMVQAVADLAILWRNDLRFFGRHRFLRLIKSLKLDRRMKGDAVEYWAKRMIRSSEIIINRGAALWKQL